MKKKWNASNPLYRWLHKRRKARRHVSTASHRKHKRIGKMGRDGSMMSGIKLLTSVLGVTFIAKTMLDVATGGKGITTGSGVKLYG